MKRHSRFDLASAANSFFAAGDHQNLRHEVLSNPLTAADIRYMLNYQLLFTDRITFIADDILVNEALVSLLANHYRPALELGLFVPLLRKGYDSIADSRHYLSAADFYNQTGAEGWQRSLDKVQRIKMQVAHFDQDEAYAHFTEVAQRYLADENLIASLGLTAPPGAIDDGVTRLLRMSGRTYWRRSALFALADEFQSSGKPDDARALRRISSVIYMAHFGGLFQQVSVFPGWYEPYVSRLASITSVHAQTVLKADTRVISSLELVMPNTRKDDLAKLTLDDVLALRASRQFRGYISTLTSGAQTTDSIEKVITALASYLLTVDEHIADQAPKGESIGKRPRKALGLVKKASDSGTVLGFVDVVTAGQFTPGVAIDAVIGGSALVLLAFDKAISKRNEKVQADRRDWWNTYCGSDGTFSAQVAKLRGRLDG